MDWISSLPDDLLCRILSLLSTKEAALTSLLSNRWRDLFAFSPDLRFEEKDFVHGNSDLDITCSFIDFLERVLAVSGNSPLKKFSLIYRQNVESAQINRWIRNVLSRGVLEHLDLDVITKGVYSLPLEVFTCKTLVKLKLGIGFVIATVPRNASLPALKTLFLDRVRICNDHGCAFEAIISACNVLEELVIVGERWKDWKWCRRVSCSTLQRLIINCEVSNDLYGFGGSDLRSIAFDTPSLVYLEYSGFVSDEHPIVNLDALVQAKITLARRKKPNNSNPTNLIKGLRNVEILDLSSLETMKIFNLFREAIPVFENLSHLSIATKLGLCWKLLPLLLEKSPNLETLVIKGPLHYHLQGYGICECLSEYNFLLSCLVKVVEITEFHGTKRELEQMKHILVKLPCLELVKVHACATDENAKLKIATDLLKLLRPCKIQLKFFPS